MRFQRAGSLRAALPRAPRLTVLDAIRKIRAAVVPALDSLSATYETEAKAAKVHKAALASLKNELRMFPVAGGTLHDWAANSSPGPSV